MSIVKRALRAASDPNPAKRRRLRGLAAAGLAVLAAGLVLPGTARAGVESVEIVERTPLLEGRSFGLAGPYERLVGRVRFAVDPAADANALVVDLDKAPRGADGLVRFHADVHLLKPVDPKRANGTLLVEVPERGRKTLLQRVNGADVASADPRTEAELGDGFLMRRGFTLAWIGWQFDVPDEAGRMGLDAVYATAVPKPVEGFVRSDVVFDAPARDMPLGADGHQAYPVAQPGHAKNSLTVRSSGESARRVIPRARWTFGRWQGGRSLPDRRSIVLFSGFDPDLVYESVYLARDPAIVGLGLVAVRDFVAHVKASPESPAPVERAVAFGALQSGRFLRHFLYQGFNADEGGGRVFDGVLAHGAGAGRGSFNHRFAQPSRGAHQFSSFFYPTDIFPFSSRKQTDVDAGRSEGLLDRLAGTGAMPKIFFTNTSYDYWGRAASLIHTALDGLEDVEPLGSERIYHIAGTQQNPAELPARAQNGAPGENPAEYSWALRALVVAMNDWVSTGSEPPPSRIPSIADRTLVRPLSVAFPLLGDARVPRESHEAYRIDFGPRFEGEGIIDWQPPAVGDPFVVLVPQVDEDGNELGGIRLPELQVPLATYTGWRWRSQGAGRSPQLADRRGSFMPFARTRAEREAAGDARLSIAERYADRDAYVGRYTRAALALVEERLLLAEDLPAVISRAERLWSVLHGGTATAQQSPAARTR